MLKFTLGFVADLGWIMALIILLVVAVANIIKVHNAEKKEEAFTPEKFNSGDLSLTEKYMDEREVIFYEYLQRALPDTCVAFPRVGVDNIVEPNGSKNFYNAIMSKYVDYVVFSKISMKPIIYVDLYEDSITEQLIKEQDKNVDAALNAVNLPKILVPVSNQNTYDIYDLKSQIADALDPVTLALLRKKK